MASRLCILFLFSILLPSRMFAQGRAPHGLTYQHPMAFSPSAYEFFHPDACATSKCSPFPLAAQVHETESQEATETAVSGRSTHNIGSGLIAGPLFGILIVVFLAMGAYYVAKTRQANSDRAKGSQADV